jgi:16S rRNA (guanine1207-N2)-methyltransferase/23S rRNA (guanine1835-N2)-methyltransferase
MNTHFKLLDRHLTLHRWPLIQKNRSLQAWDAADEYLINHVETAGLLNKQSKILLVNDSFGALSCWFGQYQRYNLSDSYVSHQAAVHNCKDNHCPLSEADMLASTDELPEDIDLVLIKVPKNNGFLEYVLSKISRRLAPGTQVIAGGKTTDIHNSTLKIFERFIGTTTTSLAKKKSRLILSALTQPPQDCHYPKHWPLENASLNIVNHANVFSRDSLDIGARLLLANLPEGTNGQAVVDLGCGNGVIGLSLLHQAPDSNICFVDESYMAVASTKDSVTLNMPDKINQCQFKVDDCLTRIPSDSADWVLCNPPFHQQQAVTDHIAWQMFKDALRVLKKGGSLIIVGNRNLAYNVKLNKLFGNCQTLDANKKFSVLSAVKSAVKG